MKQYEVMVGPILAQSDGGFEIVTPAYAVTTTAKTVKYHQDYFQLINSAGDVVFAMPHNLVMWAREVKKENSARTVEIVPSAVDPDYAEADEVDTPD